MQNTTMPGSKQTIHVMNWRAIWKVKRGILAIFLSFAFSGPALADPALLLFAGMDHKQFLGCLNCSEYDEDSVSNKYGPYGSPYSDTSIFNSYSQFGGAYGEYSPCNAYSSDPPVIVDQQGNYYGRLTINQSLTDTRLSSNLWNWLNNNVCD